MSRSARYCAERLRAEFASEEAPVDVIALATALGCTVCRPQRINKARTVEGDLRAHRDRDRFRIRVDPTPRRGWIGMSPALKAKVARHRFRFRVCHELGHTFFFERGRGKGPKRARPWLASEELWCDEFARSLLVPRAPASQMPLSADSPFALQARFDVSLEVAARALFAASNQKAHIAIWFWPTGVDVDPSALLRQWVSFNTSSLRHWRETALVAEAMTTGQAQGELASLTRSLPRLSATARCDRSRRQVLVVAKR